MSNLLLPDEIWTQIDGFPDYSVSNTGRVWSFKRGGPGQELRQALVKGYCKVTLSGKSQRYVHRLVLGAFVGPSKLEVNHKDMNPLNNKLENLEYVTRSQNELHKRGGKFGVSKFRNKFRARAWKNGKEIHLGVFATKEEAMEARRNYGL